MQELQERKVFNGLNSDDTDVVIQNGDYRYALCIDTSDVNEANVGSVVNTPGNSKVRITLPAGENRVIGTLEFIDENSVVYFLWNEFNNHGIYRYNFVGNVLELIYQSDKLNFQKDQLINHANIVDKKLLYWAQKFNPSRKININKANENGKNRKFDFYWGTNICQNEIYTFNILLGGVPQFTWNYQALNTISPLDAFGLSHEFVQSIPAGALALADFEACGASVQVIMKNTGIYTWTIVRNIGGSTDQAIAVARNFYPDPQKEDYIDRLKYPFHCNPVATYKIDSSKKTNLVQNKIFQFATQYVYDDNEKSAISPISPLPSFGSECQLNLQQSLYNYIEVDFTEDRLNDLSVRSIIKAVNILFREHNDGKFKLITTLQPYQFGWTVNKFNFYNDGIYAAISDAEATKLFDSVPITSGAQEYIGNRIFDGDIVEGYDKVCIDAELNTGYRQNPLSTLFNIKGKLQITNDWNVPASQPGFPLYNLTGMPGGGPPDPLFQNTYGKMDFRGNGTAGAAHNINTVSGLLTANQSVPLSGFVVYLAGTDYYSISKQNPQGLVADVNGVLNVRPQDVFSGDANFNSLMQKTYSLTPFQSDWEIVGVPPGVYALRIASHHTTAADLLDNKFQRTSTNIFSTSTPFTPVTGVLETGKTEAIVEILANGNINVRDPDTYLILRTVTQGVSSGTVFIEDISISGKSPIAGGTTPDTAISMMGYVVDGAGAGVPPTLPDILNMERVTRSKVTARIRDNLTPFPFIDVVQRTDHNGYYFFKAGDVQMSNAGNQLFITSIQNAITVSDTVFGLQQYLADQYPYLGGWYPTIKQFLDSANAGVPKSYELVYFYNSNLLSTTGRTFIDGRVVDANGNAVSGVNVGLTYHGFVASASDGSYSISFYDYPGGDNAILIASANSVCSLNVITIPQIFSLTIPVPYDNSNHYPVPDLIGTIISPFTFSDLKRGYDGEFGIVYYDRGNRSGTVNTNEKTKLHILFYSEPDPLTGLPVPTGQPSVAWQVRNLPPSWATHWQWVRTKNLQLSTYIQFLAGEVKYVDTPNSTAITTTYALGNYMMINLNNLSLYKDQNAASLLAYTWQVGDRIRFIADANTVYFTKYFDYEVVAEDAGYIFVKKDFAIPEQFNGTFFEIYTPRLTTVEKLFFEFGECYEVGDLNGVKFHKGKTQDQNPSNPYNVPATGDFDGGDAWYRRRMMPMLQGTAVVNKVMVVDDQSVSDFYKSLDQSIGRINIQNDEIGQIVREDTMRFSNEYIKDTNVNGLSTFLANNADTIQKGSGPIYKLQRAGRVLLAIQRKQCSSVYVNEIIYIDSSGNSTLTVSDKVIGTIRPLEGNYGTIHPESVVEFEGDVYFLDSLGGTPIRYSNDGLNPIDIKMSSYFSNKCYDISQFNNVEVQVFGGFDPFSTKYFLTFRDSDYLNPVKRIVEETIVFSDVDISEGKRWKTFLPYIPESFSFAGMEFITFNKGELWVHSNNPLYNNFYGVQYTSKVSMVANQNHGKINQYIGISQESTDPWACPALSTPPNTQYPLGMLSRLLKSKFRKVMGVWYSPIMKDMNTPNRPSQQDALINGRDMTGHVLVIDIENDSVDFVKMDAINIRYVPQEFSKK